jgi:hypothetical protein
MERIHGAISGFTGRKRRRNDVSSHEESPSKSPYLGEGGDKAAEHVLKNAPLYQDFELVDKNVSSGLTDFGYDDDDPCDCAKQLAAAGEDPERSTIKTCMNDKCINFAANIECKADQCSKGCQNRRVQRMQAIKLDLSETEGKDLGLFLGESVKKGQFIVEYVGEVIGVKSLVKRLAEVSGDASQLYVMKLTKDRFIDATSRGGLGRFINHSCEPNAKLERYAIFLCPISMDIIG